MNISFESNKCHHGGPIGAEGPGQLPSLHPLKPALPFGRVTSLNKRFENKIFLIGFLASYSFKYSLVATESPLWERPTPTGRPRANLFSSAGKKACVWRHFAVGKPTLMPRCLLLVTAM